MKIYICCHKHGQVPKSDVLQPIQVGKAIVNVNLEGLTDNIGDTISKKNKHYCELTATYWIWKNVQEDIVGLCHYRRYFNFKNNHTKLNKMKAGFVNWIGYTEEVIRPLFEKYDIILPYKMGSVKHPENLYDFYKKAHVISDLDAVLKVIKKQYPEQYEKACQILHTATQGYYGNMLVAKKAVFDAYAEWLFGILFEVEKRIQKDVHKRDVYQQRACGFLAERLMTVYVALHPELRVKEVPMVFVETDKQAWKKYIFCYWKHKILARLGLRKERK